MGFAAPIAAMAAPAILGAAAPAAAGTLGATLGSAALGSALPAAAGAALPAGATALGSAMPWLHAAGHASAGLPMGATALGGAMPWLQGAGGASSMSPFASMMLKPGDVVGKKGGGLGGALMDSMPSIMDAMNKGSQEKKDALASMPPATFPSLERSQQALEPGSLMSSINQRAKSRMNDEENQGIMDFDRLMQMYNRNIGNMA